MKTLSGIGFGVVSSLKWALLFAMVSALIPVTVYLIWMTWIGKDGFLKYFAEQPWEKLPWWFWCLQLFVLGMLWFLYLQTYMRTSRSLLTLTLRNLVALHKLYTPDLHEPYDKKACPLCSVGQTLAGMDSFPHTPSEFDSVDQKEKDND